MAGRLELLAERDRRRPRRGGRGSAQASRGPVGINRLNARFFGQNCQRCFQGTGDLGHSFQRQVLLPAFDEPDVASVHGGHVGKHVLADFHGLTAVAYGGAKPGSLCGIGV